MPPDPTQTLHEVPPVSGEQQLRHLVDIISRSQQGFRDLIDHLDQAVFTITLEGEIRVANIRFAEIVGAAFTDLIGHNLAEFLVNPAPQEAARALPAFLRAGSWSGRVPLRLKKTGELKYFDCYFQAVAEAGQVTAISGWARDVTAQHDTELRSADLFESLHEGVLFTRPTGEILDANPALLRMLGFEGKDELLQRAAETLYSSPAQRAEVLQELQSKGFARDREMGLLKKNGTPIRCMVSSHVVRDTSGAVVRIQKMIRDVSERREMEHELHKEREFGRRLVACFPDVIALLDAQGHFTYLSESVRAVLGHPPSFYLGRRLGANSSPEDRAKLDQMLQTLLSGRAVRGQVEVRAEHADGSRRSFRISAAPLLDEEGRITGIVTSGRDVTESNLLDRQHADREKFTAMGQMLAGAAHELNNPLTAILGVSDLLHEHSTDEVTQRQSALILKQARRAADIVQNLLAFSRPRSAALVPIRIEDVVNQVLLANKTSFQEKNVAMRFEAGPGLPAVDGDRKLLTQVFSNIVVNAEQAVSAAKQSGTLSVAIAPSGNGLCISFANDGPAIPSDNIGKLFDPFFTTKRPGGGSGLGLTICLAIVKDHGGTIEVDSPPSGGAVFRIFLPGAGEVFSRQNEASPSGPAAGPASPGNSGPAPKAAAAGKHHSGLQGHTALVVDDEESIVDILQDGLSARGMSVSSASNGRDALAHLEAHPCEIVICDFNMPGMKGGELFARVRERFGERCPRFLFMTGELVESGAIADLRELGAFAVQKPFHIPSLAEQIAHILSGR